MLRIIENFENAFNRFVTMDSYFNLDFVSGKKCEYFGYFYDFILKFFIFYEINLNNYLLQK